MCGYRSFAFHLQLLDTQYAITSDYAEWGMNLIDSDDGSGLISGIAGVYGNSSKEFKCFF